MKEGIVFIPFELKILAKGKTGLYIKNLNCEVNQKLKKE
jgi:hypothetical protein